jgi:hypothetical protein
MNTRFVLHPRNRSTIRPLDHLAFAESRVRENDAATPLSNPYLTNRDKHVGHTHGIQFLEDFITRSGNFVPITQERTPIYASRHSVPVQSVRFP